MLYIVWSKHENEEKIRMQKKKNIVGQCPKHKIDIVRVKKVLVNVVYNYLSKCSRRLSRIHRKKFST